MSKHRIQKSISTLLTLVITSTMIPCSAANLVPFNGEKPVIPPAVPVTKPIVETDLHIEPR